MLVAVLAAATVAGLVRRARNGRMRPPGRRLLTAQVPGSDPAGTGVAEGTGIPAGIRSQAGPAEMTATAAGQRLTEAELGAPLGTRATLLQFSSSFCAPCRSTRLLLADLAGAADGVAHIEINVADRLDLVRLLNVRRTPSVFVLGPDGRITGRASGQPRRDEVLAAVTAAQDGAR